MEILLKSVIKCSCGEELVYDYTNGSTEEMIYLECNCKKTKVVIFSKERDYAVITSEKVEDNSVSVIESWDKIKRKWRC